MARRIMIGFAAGLPRTQASAWRTELDMPLRTTEKIKGLGLGFGCGTLSELVLVGDDQSHANEFEAVVVLATSVAGVSKQDAVRVRCSELEDALALVLIGGP
jgi:hypothetical protein